MKFLHTFTHAHSQPNLPKMIIHHPINSDDDFDYLFGGYNGSKILVTH